MIIPVFVILYPIGSLSYASSRFDSPQLSAEKKLGCLYHISFQIYLGLTLVYLFIKMYYLTVFKHFV